MILAKPVVVLKVVRILKMNWPLVLEAPFNVRVPERTAFTAVKS